MISIEELHKCSFFSFLGGDQLQSIAGIAGLESFDQHATVFEEGMPAKALYFLLDGGVDLYYTVQPAFHPEARKEFIVSTVQPGEPFGISALIEPYVLTSTGRTNSPSRVIKIEASSFDQLFEEDEELAYLVMQGLAKAAIDRLNATRKQLAEVWATAQR